MEELRNCVRLRGSLAGRPEFSHSLRGEDFYIFPLEIARLSGASDTVNVMARYRLLEETEITDGGGVSVLGELRSFNNRSGEGSRLVITVFARELAVSDGEDINEVSLQGTVCRAPTLRRTPMGRQICDVMLAVNRNYGRSDYLPCIVWGRLAEDAALFEVGDAMALTGRLQSRKYIKVLPDGPEERTAFEVSVISLEEIY